VNGCAWIANGLGYAVVAALPDEELDRVADYMRLELPAAS
jgi:anti-sigma factor RsiW